MFLARWRDSIVTSPIRSHSRSAGGRRLIGSLEHVGRKSGKRYRTPLNIFDTDDGYVILIGYGPESHWVKNVLAGERQRSTSTARRCRSTDPRIVSKAEAAAAGDVGPVLYRLHPYNEAALVLTAR